MIVRLTTAASALSLLSLSAEPTLAAQAVQERDSAGVSIVVNSAAPASVPQFVLREPAEVEIGSVAGNDQLALYRVSAVRRLSDNNLIAANGPELLWLRPDGEVIHEAGGMGDGPGEYRAGIRGLSVLEGDSVFAVNAAPPALRRYTPSGELSGTARLPAGRFLHLSRLDNGRWAGLAFGGENIPRAPGMFAETWYVVRASPDGVREDTLYVLSGEQYYGSLGGEQQRLVGTPRAFLSGARDLIVAASSARYELRVFGSDAGLQRVIRHSIANPEVPRDLTAAEPDAPVAESAPAFYGLIVGLDRSIWVKRDRASESIAEWHVYDELGHLAGRLELPGRFRPTEVGASHVLGVWTNALDVEFIRLYRYDRVPGD